MEWRYKQDPRSADLVEEGVELLAENGPALGRPHVDRIRGSRVHNLKELRPGNTGTTEGRVIGAA